MSRSILYIAFFAACCAVILATPLNGIPELPSLNLDFPPPVPNAPDLQTAGAYPTNSPIRPDGKLSGALANQNIFMEPLGGVEFGKSFGGFGKQIGGTGMNSGFNQNTGTGFGSPSLGQQGMKSGFRTPSGSFGEVPNAGIGQMDINSGIGNPSGFLGEVPNAGAGQPVVDLGLTSGQGSAPTSGQVQPQTNTYRSGTPQVPGIRGGVRNISRRPMPFMPIFTPPPVILLPPRRPFSFMFGRRPRLVTIPLIPLGAPVPISMARRPF